MANKRILKKRIRRICGEAALDVLLSLPEETAEKIIFKIAQLQSRNIAKISFGFDHVRKDFESVKAYNEAREAYTRTAYKKLNEDFNKELAEIVKEINVTLTPKDREANKKLANKI